MHFYESAMPYCMCILCVSCLIDSQSLYVVVLFDVVVVVVVGYGGSRSALDAELQGLEEIRQALDFGDSPVYMRPSCLLAFVKFSGYGFCTCTSTTYMM